MKHVKRNFRAISPVLAVLMMIAVAIAGSLVTYAWVMGYIGLSTERSGEAIIIQSLANHDVDLMVYVQNVGEGVVQLEEDGCLYVDGVLVSSYISGVSVSDDVGTLNQGDTATLTYFGGAAVPGDKVTAKVTTLLGTSAEKTAHPAGTTKAEPGSVRWTRTYEGTSGSGRSLVVTSDGGYAIAGISGVDVGLVKTDAYGNMEWNKTYGGTESDVACSLVATSDGGYVLAGFTGSFGAGWDDLWLIKTDAYGNMEWNKTYGGTGKDMAYSLVATPDGGYAIAGYTDSSDTGFTDFWLVKTDEFGNMEWNRTYGGPNYDRAYSLVATPDGGYALAGFTASSGTGEDFWLVKTDADGNMEWNKTYEDTDVNRARSLVVTSDGGYAIAGPSGSFVDGFNSFNLRLVKTDASGNMEWNKKYTGPNDEGFDLFTGLSIVETSDGGYAIAGYLSLEEALQYEGWLVKTDASGNVEWNKTYGGTARDRAYSLIETSDGGYAIAGTSGGDFWLVKTY